MHRYIHAPSLRCSYYEYLWQRNKGVSFGSLFQGMPLALQADISFSLYKDIIDQVSITLKEENSG